MLSTRALALWLIVVWLLGLTSAYAWSAPSVIGTAFAQGSDRILYREHFYYDDTGQLQRVDYFDRHGEIIARKNLYPSAKPFQPSFVQKNFVNGRVIDVTVSDSRVNIAYQKDNDAKTLQGVVDLQRDSVIDAGFDPFVIQHWERLVAGEELSLSFLAPTRIRSITLLIRRQDCELESAQQAASMCLQIRPRSLPIRWLMGNINLVYDSQRKQLLRFSGLGNLSSREGRQLKVDIFYQREEQGSGSVAADSLAYIKPSG